MKIYPENLVQKTHWGNQIQKFFLETKTAQKRVENESKLVKKVTTRQNRKNQVHSKIISMHKTLCTLNFGFFVSHL